MDHEKSMDAAGKRRRARRWLPVGGVVLAAILAGGVLALVISGRDDARPLAAEASPTPTATVQTPSPTATPSASPSPSATPAQTPEPTATPAPASDTDAWIGPERIATRDYGELSLVVDDHGIAHAAAELDHGIYYLTNASGSWTREPLSSPLDGGHDGGPAIALDRDGSLTVAFVRYRSWQCGDLNCYSDDPDGIYLATNRSGGWSQSARVPLEVTPLRGHHRLVLKVLDGNIHLAWTKWGEYYQVWHATNASGGWITAQVTDDGWGPSLELASDGTARLAFTRTSDGADGLYYAIATTRQGPFTLQRLPHASRQLSLLRLDTHDQPHIVYTDQDGVSRYTRLEDASWSAPQVAFPDTPTSRCGWWKVGAEAMTISEGGTVRLVSRNTTIFSGLWFATSRNGPFEARQLWPPRAADDACDGAIDADPTLPTAMAVDRAGRPHVLFITGWGSETELWYAIGPGD